MVQITVTETPPQWHGGTIIGVPNYLPLDLFLLGNAHFFSRWGIMNLYLILIHKYKTGIRKYMLCYMLCQEFQTKIYVPQIFIGLRKYINIYRYLVILNKKSAL